MNTSFSIIYDRFLGKITDDMYVELTPGDTLRDLQSLLIDALPGFEFPRTPLLDNYTIQTTIKKRSEISDDDFVIGEVNILDEDPFSQNVFLDIPEEDKDVYID